jgi:hypothetical protein
MLVYLCYLLHTAPMMSGVGVVLWSQPANPLQKAPRNSVQQPYALGCACLAALCRRLACSTSPASLLPPRNQRRQLARQQHLRLLAAMACPRRHQPSPAQPQASRGSELWSWRQAQAQRQVWWLQLTWMRQGHAHGGGGQRRRKTEQNMHARASREPVALDVAGRVVSAAVRQI